jgi:hypothetical protein
MIPYGIKTQVFGIGIINTLYFPILLAAALVLDRVGLIDSDMSSAKVILKVGILLFNLVLLLATAISIVTFFRIKRLKLQSEQQALLCITESIPFLFVRHIYTLLTSFDLQFQNGPTARAAIVFAMEFIIVGLYLAVVVLTNPFYVLSSKKIVTSRPTSPCKDESPEFGEMGP